MNLIKTSSFFWIVISCWQAAWTHAQDVWEPQSSGSSASLRGLSTVNAKTCWASGSAGTVLRTSDGGETWNTVSPPDMGDLDFRDIEAFDDQSAVIMSAGEIDRVYRTVNAGQSWTLAYEHPNKSAFFDGMAFGDELHGWIMSDPIEGRLLILKTVDGGITWQPLPPEQSPVIELGEAGFAASGTNLVAIGKRELSIAVGGASPETNSTTSRIVTTHNGGLTWNYLSVPIARNPSSGMFSLSRIDERHWVAVGGNYQLSDNNSENIVISLDGGSTWQQPSGSKPTGYRSVVAFGRNNGEHFLLAAGPNGTDWSKDFGRSWQRISEKGFHTMDFSSDLTAGWGAGGEGRIAKWVGPVKK
jgi:photosystem II stability/assembly factor-like uncharacterized protein